MPHAEAMALLRALTLASGPRKPVDGLRAPRGILVACLLGTALWAFVVAVLAVILL